MNTYKFTIREFPDKRKNKRYSIEVLATTHGFYSLAGIIKIIKKTLNGEECTPKRTQLI